MIRSLYTLSKQISGFVGSTWSKIAAPDTKLKAKALTQTAGSWDLLSDLDTTVGSSLGVNDVRAREGLFNFTDGNFAVVGRHPDDYKYTEVIDAAGRPVYYGVQREPYTRTDDPVVLDIAKVTGEFRRAIGDGTFTIPEAQDIYLVPTPDDMELVMIETKDPEVTLVLGVDFEQFPGYIMMSTPPADVLPLGAVRVPLFNQLLEKKDSYVLDTPAERYSSKFLSSYRYKQQSLAAYKRAAAEYAGLFVFERDDIVLHAQEFRGGTLYTTARSSHVFVPYDHEPIAAGTSVPSGFIVSGFFDVRTAHDEEDTRKTLLQTRGLRVDVSATLPLPNISWDFSSRLRVVAGATHASGKVHSVLNLFADDTTLTNLARLQQTQEECSGEFLIDALGEVTHPFDVDFWDILSGFYGDQLIVVAAESHGDKIDAKLTKFLKRQHPTSVVAIVDVATRLPFGSYLLDADGDPALDDAGNLIADEIDNRCYAVFGSQGEILSTAANLWGDSRGCD